MLRFLLGLRESEPEEPESLIDAPIQVPLIKQPDHPIVQALNLRTGRGKYSQPVIFPNSQPSSLHQRLFQREYTGRLHKFENSWLAHSFLPQTQYCSTVLNFSSQIFCGQYSADGNTFMSACQDRSIRLYDTSGDNWVLRHQIRATEFRWSILDCAYSSHYPWIIYSSWAPSVQLCCFEDGIPKHRVLHLSTAEYMDSGIFAVRFSANSKEILAGASDSRLHVYDLEHDAREFSISAHEDDINAVEYGDQLGNIILSGSDDCFVKVWDRRIIRPRTDCKPVGVFVGHLAGITHVNASLDGNYVISNSKDQSIKLWDFRKMTESDNVVSARISNWDYRYGTQYLNPNQRKYLNGSKCHRGDNSIMTYRGHSVLRTLIRSYFSPMETTGQKYIYTGSSDGNVYIYDVLTGEIVSQLTGHRGIVRDVSWHPHLPVIASTSWDATVKEWGFKESGKVPQFNDQDEDDSDEDYY